METKIKKKFEIINFKYHHNVFELTIKEFNKITHSPIKIVNNKTNNERIFIFSSETSNSKIFKCDNLLLIIKK